MPDTVTDTFDTLSKEAPQSLCEVMEIMAFVCAEPVAPPDVAQLPCTERYVRLRMPFIGCVKGNVEVIAPEGLGKMISENMLGGDEPAASSRYRHDALLELLNMTCGVLFRGVSSELGAQFEIGLPECKRFDVDAHWQPFVSRVGAKVLDADGFTVAIGVFPGGSDG